MVLVLHFFNAKRCTFLLTNTSYELTAINEIVDGMTFEEEFYRSLLDKMVVHYKDHIDLYLNLLPYKWSYTVAQATKAHDIEINAETEAENSEEDMRHFSTRYRYRRAGASGNGGDHRSSACQKCYNRSD